MRQFTKLGKFTKPSVSLHIDDKDFFGIRHVTSKDVAGSFKSKSKLVQEQLINKYLPLMQPREQLENKEHETDVAFGSLRVDGDNIVRRHGQYESDNERKLYDTKDIKQKYVPIDVTAECNDVIENEDTIDTNEFPDLPESEIDNYNRPYKISEVTAALNLSEVLKIFKKNDTAENLLKYSNKPPLIFYFKKTLFNDYPSSDEETYHGLPERSVKGILPRSRPKKASSSNETVMRVGQLEQSEEPKLSGHQLDEAELESTIVESNFELDKKPVLRYHPDKDQIPISELEPGSEEYQDRMVESLEFDKSIDEKFDIGGHRKSSKKALEYLKDIRAKRVEPTSKGLKHRLQTDNPYSLKPIVKLDSQGFRNYTNQVPNWYACRHIDILSHIRSSIIYNNYDILAINKPYGIASHIDANSKTINMNNLVQEIATAMRIEKVYLAHRLDMSTTGVLLFATTQKRANFLNKLFKSDQITKTYWAITNGVPRLEHALIDIPIGRFTVAGKVRRCVVPEALNEEKQLDRKSSEARRAITEYKVLKSTKHAALLDVKPRSGVTHQIRCHLGFGLNTAILGDHKYSHIEKVAPQRLPAPLLKDLHLRQEKVRTLPMHLHAKTIVIPGAKANGETLFIEAPLPQHFVENMKSLKLTIN